nr:hypothetical protein [Allomuricauda sp.]
MFSKSNLLATLVGAVVMFFLGYLIWGIAAADFLEQHSIVNVMKDPPDMAMIALGNLVGAFIVSTLYSKWARGHHSMGHGFQFGAWIGALLGIAVGLIWYATANFMDLTGHLASGILDIIYYGIVGAVIALVYQKTATKE